MAAIGSRTVLSMVGQQPSDPQKRVGEITRVRVNGHAFIDLGKRGNRVQVVTVVDVDDAAAEKALQLALQGTLVTVVTPDGESVTNVIVQRVIPVRAKKTLTPVGGINAGTWLLTTVWLLQGTNV